jgi:hypothetical protein
MDALIGQPIFNYTQIDKSKIYAYGRNNCCWISSFQIQIQKYFPDFPDLKTLLELLYPNTNDAYTHFALDFPSKWLIIKKYLTEKNIKWNDKLSNIIIEICLPLVIQDKCVLLALLDLDKLNPDEIKIENYNSIKESFLSERPTNKIIISIMQYENHFEPIQIEIPSDKTSLVNTELINMSEVFFL